jgi:hypothetical protein
MYNNDTCRNIFQNAFWNPMLECDSWKESGIGCMEGSSNWRFPTDSELNAGYLDTVSLLVSWLSF